MQHVRFYLEYASAGDKRRKQHAGTVVAIVPEHRRAERIGGTLETVYEGVGAVQSYPDCPVASTSVSAGYLRSQCKRISEAQAREVHPNLFAYLDEAE